MAELIQTYAELVRDAGGESTRRTPTRGGARTEMGGWTSSIRRPALCGAPPRDDPAAATRSPTGPPALTIYLDGAFSARREAEVSSYSR